MKGWVGGCGGGGPFHVWLAGWGCGDDCAQRRYAVAGRWPLPRDINQISDAELRLAVAPGIGPVTHRKLMQHFGTAEAIIGAPVGELAQIAGIGKVTAQALRRALDGADIDAERQAMEKAGARMVFLEDEDYPPLLAAIDDAPPVLWICGGFAAADQLSVAIVGSRRCTAYGREQAGRFASLLAQAGLTIVSGGAFGIDGEAHRGALRVKGRTIVVLGCGLSNVYPPQHKELFQRVVAEGGAIVSQYRMGAQPRKEYFPQRNRIISGLSLGVLVIEAAWRSGALITARCASDDHNREVMAVPGRVDSPASAGCLQAIRDGMAALVCDHVDVLNQLEAARHLVRGALESRGQAVAIDDGPSLFDGTLNDAQRAIIEALEPDGSSTYLDQIAARTQLPMSRIMAELTLLQIRERIARDHVGVRLRKGQGG